MHTKGRHTHARARTHAHTAAAATMEDGGTGSGEGMSRAPLKRLHWQKIGGNKLRGSIWESVAMTQAVAEVDKSTRGQAFRDEIARLFAEPPPRKFNPGGKKGVGASLELWGVGNEAGARRAQAIEIMLSRFSKRLSLDAVASAVRALDVQVMEQRMNRSSCSSCLCEMLQTPQLHTICRCWEPRTWRRC